MLKIGEYNRLKIARELSFGLFLEDKDEEVLLPKKFISNDMKIDNEIDVFVYTDSEDRPVATTQKPYAVVGEFAYLKVVDTADFGAFLDWGLDKDLFIPASKQAVPFDINESFIVKLMLDREERVIATSKIKSLLIKEVDESDNLRVGDRVDLMIYEFDDLGIFVIINNKYSGLLFKNEVFEDLNVGDKRVGYIKNIREDGKIDVSLKEIGKKAVYSDREKILNKLKKSKKINFTYKSSPEDIKRAFGMSRKAFKRVLTSLIEDKLIELSEDGIKLNGNN